LQTEQGGLEVLSGCFGLLALIIAGGTGGIARFIHVRRNKHDNPARQRLNNLLVDFCTGVDATSVQVQRIQILLITSFGQESEYKELTTAVATFAPSGRPPFHDEAWLEERFRAFLRGQGITLPDYGKEQPGVWPPPPNLRA